VIISYHDYKESIIQNVVKNEKYSQGTVFVFENIKSKKIAVKYYNKDNFSEKNLFLTFEEFKERVLLSERIVLREEKPALLFYKSIPSWIKEELNINNYYDVIDIAYNFINFYAELNDYGIEKLENLNKWQKKMYDYFEIIKEEFYKLLEEKGYILAHQVNNFKYLNLKIFTGYNQIVYVNIIKSTKFEKRLIKMIEAKGFQTYYELQIKKYDFNEETLEIEQLSFPEDLNIAYIESDSEEIDLLNLFKQIREKDNPKVISPDLEFIKSKKYLSKNKLQVEEKYDFTDTSIYKFLSCLYDLISSLEKNGKYKLYKISDLILAFETEIFRSYYQIDYEMYHKLLKLSNESYIYLDKKFIKSNMEIPLYICLNEIFEDIEAIFDVKNLKDCIEFLDRRIDLQKKDKTNKFVFEDVFIKDNIAKYYEALSEIISIENMDIVDDWSEYFPNTGIAENLFRMVLKFLREKKVQKIKVKEPENIIKNIFDVQYDEIESDTLVIYNLNDSNFPSKKSHKFLLSEKQKKDLGILTSDKEKIYEKYRMIQIMTDYKEIIILGQHNEETGVGRASFVDELIYSKKAKIYKSEYDMNDFSKVIRMAYKNEKYKDIYVRNLDDNLPAVINDYEENTINLGYYDYNTLVNCPFKYYISRKQTLEQLKIENKYKLENKYIGIIAHKIFERVSQEKKEEILKNNFYIDRKRLKKILEQILNEDKLKIPQRYKKYYREILFEAILKSVKEFYKLLEIEFKHNKIELFTEEKRKNRLLYSENFMINLKGRIDLLAEVKSDRYIFDYKTGRSETEQLDFYSILYYGEADVAQKYVYNIFKQELKKGDNQDCISKDEMIIQIKNIFSKKYYELAEKKATCNYCNYLDICRQRWNDEK